LNAHFLFITYLYHVPPTCLGVSRSIFEENSRVPYSAPQPAMTQDHNKNRTRVFLRTLHPMDPSIIEAQ